MLCSILSRVLTVNSSVLQSQVVQLVAEGLDTIATVYINGIMVGKSDNMFVKYTFDVKSVLKVRASTQRTYLISTPPVTFVTLNHLSSLSIRQLGYSSN